MTIEGLSEKFDKEYWNYAKLISGVLRCDAYRQGYQTGRFSLNSTVKTSTPGKTVWKEH